MAGIHYGGNFVIIQEQTIKAAESKLRQLERSGSKAKREKEDLRGTIRRAKQRLRDYSLSKDIPNIPDTIIKETVPNVPRDYEEGDQ